MASQELAADRARLAQIAALKAEGILTDEEYAAKRAGIIDEIASEPKTHGDLDGQGRHVNWLGITIASMLVPFFGLYGIYAWITRFSWKRRSQSALVYWSPALVVLALIATVAAVDPQAFDGEGSQTQAGTKPQPLSIGDAWVAAKDGWTITVTNATTTDAFQGGIIGLPHVAQGTYLAVMVRLENTAAGDTRWRAGSSCPIRRGARTRPQGSTSRLVAARTDRTSALERTWFQEARSRGSSSSTCPAPPRHLNCA